MKEVDTLPPYCYPLEGISVDQSKLYSSIITLLNRLCLDIDDINAKPGFAINLTHLPGLTGEEAWRNYSAGHLRLVEQGINEGDFTEHLVAAKDLYVGELVQAIYQRHLGFQGRCQLIWLGARNGYNFHTDPHTPNRYHVPVITNPECYWLFKDHVDVYKLHMPADERVWYLDPINIKHTFHNGSNTSRLHLLLTSAR